MRQKIYFQIVLLTVLVGFFVFGMQDITIGRGADYVTTTDLTLDPDSVFLGEAVLLSAHVWSPQIMLIPQGIVLFEDVTHGLFQTTIPLNELGYATYSWTIPSTYPTGTIIIHARYAGNDWFEPSEDYKQLSIDIGLNPTTTELTLNPTSVLPGETVTMTAEVQSSVTLLIPQGNVQFEDKTNSKILGTVSLDATGLVQLQWTVPNNQQPKTLNIRANYLGDPDRVFASSKDANSLVIKRFSSVTTLTLSSIEVWDEVADIEIMIQVSGIRTSRTPTGTITLYDQTNDFLIDTFTLDNMGFASKTWTIPNSYSAGEIELAAVYNGNSWFKASSNSGNFTIKNDGTPPEIRLSVKDQEVIGGFINIEISAEDERNVTILVNDEMMTGNPVLYGIDTENFPDGEFLLNIQAVDESNNKAVLNRTIIIDNTPPNVQLEYKEDTKTMIVTVQDQHLNTTSVYVNQSILEDWTHPQNSSETEENYSVGFTNLPPGTYHIQVDSVDWIGNIGFATLIIVLEEIPISEPSEQSSEVISSENTTEEPNPPSVSKNSFPISVIGLGVIGLVFVAIKQISGRRGVSLKQYARNLVNGRRRE